MKKILFPVLAVAAIVMAGCSSMVDTSVDPVLAAAVKARIESRDYTVRFDEATPNSNIFNRLPHLSGPVTLSRDYNISISGDSISSSLPYFGEAYTAVLGRQDGLVFEEKVSDYKVTAKRKGYTEITFWTRTFEDRYDYTLEVYPNGRAYLMVFPDRKSSISFDGKLEFPE